MSDNQMKAQALSIVVEWERVSEHAASDEVRRQAGAARVLFDAGYYGQVPWSGVRR
jgi:hypothetical protein